MTAKILEGKTLGTAIKAKVKQDVELLKSRYGLIPGLAVIIVGDDPASQVYVARKDRNCQELGLHSEVVRLPASTTRERLLEIIDSLNRDRLINGILLQLPLPDHLKVDEADILSCINPDKDVDGFHPINVGKLVIGQERLVPCTPLGCVKMLEAANIPLAGKRAVVIGRSNIVGKPMFSLLAARHATVTLCHSRTRDLPDIARRADLLVAAVGKAGFVTADMVKPGAVVLDVGINRTAGGKIVGDVDFPAVSQVAGVITPVPGGVGQMTIAMLMHNTVKAALIQHNVYL